LVSVLMAGVIHSAAAQPLARVGHYGENIGAVAVSGTKGVFNEGTRIRVMDLTNPAQPSYRGSVNIGMVSTCLVMRGNTAYSGSAFGTVHIIDITNRTAQLSFRPYPTSLGLKQYGCEIKTIMHMLEH
jgi:hypothetical protein